MADLGMFIVLADAGQRKPATHTLLPGCLVHLDLKSGNFLGRKSLAQRGLLVGNAKIRHLGENLEVCSVLA